MPPRTSALSRSSRPAPQSRPRVHSRPSRRAAARPTTSPSPSGTTSPSASTLGTGDVWVSGRPGFPALPVFLGVDLNADGTPRTATYRLTPPGGSWDVANAHLCGLPAAERGVRHGRGFVPTVRLGEFVVAPPAAVADVARERRVGSAVPGDEPRRSRSTARSSSSVPWLTRSAFAWGGRTGTSGSVPPWTPPAGGRPSP